MRGLSSHNRNHVTYVNGHWPQQLCENNTASEHRGSRRTTVNCKNRHGNGRNYQDKLMPCTVFYGCTCSYCNFQSYSQLDIRGDMLSV